MSPGNRAGHGGFAGGGTAAYGAAAIPPVR